MDDVHQPTAICVVGFSGPFFDWGVGVLGLLLADAGHALEQVLELTDDHPAVQMLVGVDAARNHPDLPLIAFVDAPDAALQSMLAYNGDLAAHARAMTAVVAGLIGMANRVPLLLVRPDIVGNISKIAGVMAQFLGVRPADIPLAPHATVKLDSISTQLADRLLAPMVQNLVSGQREIFEVPISCFYADNHQPGVPMLDLVGPARLLYWGPYFGFPPGRWRIELDLLFSADIGDTHFAAEFYCEAILARVKMRPSGGGLFRASFDVQMNQHGALAELRIWLERGAIQGAMALKRTVFAPI